MRQAGLRAVTVSELAALAPERQTSWKRIAFVVLGVAAIVTVIFQRTDRQQIIDAWEIFRQLSVPLVIVALLANFASVWFKAVVWKTSLDTIPQLTRIPLPADRPGDLRRLPAQHGAGRAPRRGGADVRAEAPAAQEGRHVRMPTIAGTVVMEQIILGITLVVFVIMA